MNENLVEKKELQMHPKFVRNRLQHQKTQRQTTNEFQAV
jgi:hypothetical protein